MILYISIKCFALALNISPGIKILELAISLRWEICSGLKSSAPAQVVPQELPAQSLLASQKGLVRAP